MNETIPNSLMSSIPSERLEGIRRAGFILSEGGTESAALISRLFVMAQYDHDFSVRLEAANVCALHSPDISPLLSPIHYLSVVDHGSLDPDVTRAYYYIVVSNCLSLIEERLSRLLCSESSDSRLLAIHLLLELRLDTLTLRVQIKRRLEQERNATVLWRLLEFVSSSPSTSVECIDLVTAFSAHGDENVRHQVIQVCMHALHLDAAADVLIHLCRDECERIRHHAIVVVLNGIHRNPRLITKLTRVGHQLHSSVAALIRERAMLWSPLMNYST
jgi:hypothetical protein